MLDPTDGLDLRGLTVRAPVLPVLVISAVLLTLHDVLLTSVARELITHKTAHTIIVHVERKRKRSSLLPLLKCMVETKRVCVWGLNSRATLDMHGAYLDAAPAHSLQ